MDWGMKHDFHFGQGHPFELPGNLADHRHPHADEDIALSILSRPGLEEYGRSSHLWDFRGIEDGFGGHAAP